MTICVSRALVSDKGKNIPGYEDDVLSRATKASSDLICLSDSDFQVLKDKYSSHRYTPAEGLQRVGLVQASSPPPISFATKARNFAASAAKHLAAGMPQATEEQVAERFAICQGCEHFDGKACGKCGCPVVREKKFLSKLSWAGESCPVGKWGPVSS
jgi:hypothetical protein